MRRDLAITSIIILMASIGCAKNTTELTWSVVATAKVKQKLEEPVKIYPTDGKYVYLLDSKKLMALDKAKFSINESIDVVSGTRIAFTTAAAISDDGSKALVAGYPDILLVLQLPEMHIEHTIKVPKSPTAITIDPVSGLVYITSDEAGTVCEVDSSRGRITRKLSMGKSPSALAFDPLERVLYVGYRDESYLSAIDIKSFKETHRYQIGSPKFVLSVGGNIGVDYILPWNRGRYIFACGRASQTLYKVDTRKKKVDQLKLPTGCTGLAIAGGLLFSGTGVKYKGAEYTQAIDPKTMQLRGLIRWCPRTVEDDTGAYALSASPEGDKLYTITHTMVKDETYVTAFEASR